jgi:hypothetical protein
MAEKPKWVDDLSKEADCKSTNLCSVGDGADREGAIRNATLGISKVFDNQISSKFESKLSSDGETMKEEIKQATEIALQGIELKKFYEDGGKFYAMASINKRKAASILKKEIDVLDEKMKVLIGETNSSAHVDLEKVFIKRESLEKRYGFLTGASLPSPVKYEDIFKSKKEATKNIIVHVYIDEDEPKEMEQAIADQVAAMGFKFSRGQTRNPLSTHVVTGELKVDKQFLKVEGFEKYKFVLHASAMTKDRIGTGEMTLVDIETARNFSQAHDKAIEKLKEQLKEEISSLEID